MTSDRIRKVRHMVRLDRLSWLVAVFAAVTAFGAWTEVGAATPSSFDEAAENAEPVPPPADDRVIGRVTGVHGRVYAEAPDGTRRLLVDNAPIYPGDRLVTARGGQLGVLSGDHYTGLSDDTELSFALTPGGAPEVRLVRGHVRVLEAGDESAPAQVSTPSLQIAKAGGDIEVYAFPEKAYLVSMVCALEGQVQAASIAGGSATVAAGGCAVLKPTEGIYAAGAPAGVPPPILAPVSSGPPISPAGPAPSRFENSPRVDEQMRVARQAPAFNYDGTLWTACQTGASAAGCGAAGGGNPPTNPPVPGPLPPFPTNPPTNPPVPGPLPPFPTP